jgi:LSD1 subclass zinc finger protein
MYYVLCITRPLSTSTAAAAAGAQATAATNPQTQKYVCCGGCKQWLSAPRDANLVYCPGCEAVNDCSLVSARGFASAALYSAVMRTS